MYLNSLNLKLCFIDCNKNIIEEINDSIEKSRLIIFCLNNDLIRSNQFSRFYNLAIEFKRFILIVLLDKINQLDCIVNLNDFKVIHAYKDIDFTCSNINIQNNESMHRLCFLIYTFFDELKDKLKCLSLLYRNSIQSEYSHNNIFTKYKEIFIDNHDQHNIIFVFEANKHFITYSSTFYSINCNVYNLEWVLIKTLPLIRPKAVCYIQHLNRLCIIVQDHTYELSHNIYLMDNSYNLIDSKKLQIQIDNKMFCINHMIYNQFDRLLYTKCEMTGNFSIFILNDSFQVIKHFEDLYATSTGATKFILSNNRIHFLDAKLIHVHDLEFKYLTSFNHHVNQTNRLFNYIECDQRHIFTYEKFNDYVNYTQDNVISVYNLKNYAFIGYLKNSTELRGSILNFCVFEDKLYFIKKNKVIVYNLNCCKSYMNDNQWQLDHKSTMICNLNASNTHLLFNPYVLPCGNLACLKCIYENTNAYTNEILCEYKTCKKHHLWNIEFIKSNIIEFNLKQICMNFIRYPIEKINQG